MATETEFLAFVNEVMGEAFQMAMQANKAGSPEVAAIAFALLESAGRKKRELLGLPEPDPEVDYDEDYHADGSLRLPGEARREKGEQPSDACNLAELRRLYGQGEGQ